MFLLLQLYILYKILYLWNYNVKRQIYNYIIRYHMVTVSTTALAVAMSSAAADPYTIPVNGVESDSHVATALETVVDTIALEVPSNIDVLENNGTISSSALFSTDPSSRTAAAAHARGVAGEASLASFTNNGDISAAASTVNAFPSTGSGASTALATAVGNLPAFTPTDFVVTGDFTNNGTISASVEAADNPSLSGEAAWRLDVQNKT
ncbi:MAG: hypothetical protein CME93_04435 [Hyphomonadaceae bacterium]|nr:hypothetical protein [Hyphomonadaceae bacterium]